MRTLLVLAVPAAVAAILAAIVVRFAPITPGANLAACAAPTRRSRTSFDARSVLFTSFLTPPRTSPSAAKATREPMASPRMTETYFLELNTLRGLTTSSPVPQELRDAGIDFRDFLERQIQLARRRTPANAR